MSCSRGTNLWFVLDLQVRSCKELGVDPLGQPSIDLAPWCPDGKAKVKRARDGKNNVPDDPPQESVQEEEDKIHKIHDGQGESYLVHAKSITKVFVVAGLDLHADHGFN